MSDTFDLQQAAAAERLGVEIATGHVELQPVDNPGEAADILAQLPPPAHPSPSCAPSGRRMRSTPQCDGSLSSRAPRRRRSSAVGSRLQ